MRRAKEDTICFDRHTRRTSMSSSHATDPVIPSPLAGAKRAFQPDIDSPFRQQRHIGNGEEIPNTGVTNQSDQSQTASNPPSAPPVGTAPTNATVDAFLQHTADPDTANLAKVLGWCDKVSTTMDNLVNSFINEHPTEGNFMRSWISIGIGRVIQGRMTEAAPQVGRAVNAPTPRTHGKKDDKQLKAATYAEVIGTGSSSSKPEPDAKRRVMKASPPRNQGDNDRRVMIRFSDESPVRQMEAYTIRERIRASVQHPDIVQDAWHVKSGVAVLTPSPAKAAELLQDGFKLKVELGAQAVEQQDNWTTFVVGPISKRQIGLNSMEDVTQEMVKNEVYTATPKKIAIQACTWTRRTESPHLAEGYARVCLKTPQAHLFPPRLRLFGRPVTVNRIKAKPTVSQCSRCHGFHNARNCARPAKCLKCGAIDHPGDACPRPERCLNCRGPYPSDHAECPARPKYVGGNLSSPTRRMLRAIRRSGGHEYALKHPRQDSGAQPDSPREGAGFVASSSNTYHALSDSAEAQAPVESSTDHSAPVSW